MYTIEVFGRSEDGQHHREIVHVNDYEAKTKMEAIQIALRSVAKNFNNRWQFYVDW